MKRNARAVPFGERECGARTAFRGCRRSSCCTAPAPPGGGVGGDIRGLGSSREVAAVVVAEPSVVVCVAAPCLKEDGTSSNYNRANEHVCGNRLLERLMSPSPKSQVMFASAFS